MAKKSAGGNDILAKHDGGGEVNTIEASIYRNINESPAGSGETSGAGRRSGAVACAAIPALAAENKGNVIKLIRHRNGGGGVVKASMSAWRNHWPKLKYHGAVSRRTTLRRGEMRLTYFRGPGRPVTSGSHYTLHNGIYGLLSSYYSCGVKWRGPAAAGENTSNGK